MAKQLKLKRGTTSQHSSFTGAEGEVTVDTDKETLVVHDGSTAGGHPVAAEDMANVSSASIAGRLGTDSIATSKIAGGALPTDVTVASANLVDGTIVNADVNSSAAIAGTKVSPDFGSQAVTTTGNIVVGGTVDGRDVAADGSKLDGIESGATADQTAAEIKTLVGNASDSNVFTDADHAKLDALTTSNGAIVNGVTATTQSAGDASTKIATTAYTDTAVSNLVDSSPSALNTLNELAAAIGDDANFASTTATNIAAKLPKSGGQMTGNITMAGSQTVDGRDVSADGSKLDGIESGATADQTNAEIRTAVEAASDSNVFTDADHSKLDGIASSANNYSHPNHSGEVTSSGDGATTIADNVVDEANLKVSNSPTNGYFLSAQSGNTGGLTWAQVAQPDLTNLSASNLTSGTVPDARFPATLPAASAANLTSIPAANLSGTLPAVSAANLTNIPAANITGTLPAISGANLTGLSSACTRVKVGISTQSNWSVPHYYTGYQSVPGTEITFDNVTSDLRYLIYHGYQLRSDYSSNDNQNRRVLAYFNGATHGGSSNNHYNGSYNYTTYGPYMAINTDSNTNDRTFSVKGRSTWHTSTYGSIANAYVMVMEFKVT